MKTIFLAVALVTNFAAAPIMAEQFSYFQTYQP